MTPFSYGALAIWCIAILAIAGVIVRPKQWPEAIWACAGATSLVVFGLVSAGEAWRAVGKGTDVYLFLAGMMLLAELARRNGVFDWVAVHAVAAARGSKGRLFALVYGAGVLVTVFLSNDATAVVLTPAVYAAVKRARAEVLPYLFVCAFIANAASFVLPISNPANLVVYGKSLPPLLDWLSKFLLPSVCSIGATYCCLWLALRRNVAGPIPAAPDAPPLTPEGRAAAWSIGLSAAVLAGASAFGLDLGLPTLLTGVIAALAITRGRPRELLSTARGVAWSVLPLVAGLFVIVEGLSQAGVSGLVARLLSDCVRLGRVPGALAASFGIALLSNIMNNLPSGLLSGAALSSTASAAEMRHAVLLGVDLGPNLSVTGSLATVLWLIALRREGVRAGAWQFLKLGALVMPPALLLTTLALCLSAR